MILRFLYFLIIIIYGLVCYIFIRNSTKEEDNEKHVKIVKAQLIMLCANPESEYYQITLMYKNKFFSLYGKVNYIIASRYSIDDEIEVKYDEELSEIIGLVNS